MQPQGSRWWSWAVAGMALSLLLAGTPLRPARASAQQRQTPSRPQPQTQPDEPPAYAAPSPSKSVEIGNFYLKRKNYRGALSRFEEAVQTDAEYAPGYLGLAQTCEKLGFKQRALSAYQRYLDLLPSDRDAEEARGVHRSIARLQEELHQSAAGSSDKLKAVSR